MKRSRSAHPFSRRGFFQSIGKGLASMAVLPQSFYSGNISKVHRSALNPADVADDWFSKIKGKHRIVYDATSIHEGFSVIWSWVFMESNNENGISDNDLTTVVVLRHNAFALALNDKIWSSYKLGRFLNIQDPASRAPVTVNPYWDPAEGIMPEPGMSIRKLIERGAMFCVCERALAVNSKEIARLKNLNPEHVKQEWLDGLLPEVQQVPSGVWAVNLAQENGCSYCFAG